MEDWPDTTDRVSRNQYGLEQPDGSDQMRNPGDQRD